MIKNHTQYYIEIFSDPNRRIKIGNMIWRCSGKDIEIYERGKSFWFKAVSDNRLEKFLINGTMKESKFREINKDELFIEML